MGTEYNRTNPLGPPQPIKTSPEVTTCAVTLRTSFFCCRLHSSGSFKKSVYIFFFLIYIRFYCKYFGTHRFMCIAPTELAFIWILCCLADICSLAHLVCVSSARRLYQNETVASHCCKDCQCFTPLDTALFLSLPDWCTGVFLSPNSVMSSVKNITSSARRHADKPKARGCGHWINGWDVHRYCPSCRENNSVKGKLPADPCMNGDPCQICETFSADQLDKIASRRK